MKLLFLISLSIILTNSSPVAEFVSILPDHEVDSINPCKDKDLLTCEPASIAWSNLWKNTITLPGSLVLEKVRHFEAGKVSFHLFSDEFGNEAFFGYRNFRLMGRFRSAENRVFFIEPCNNWEGCHVWKEIDTETFKDETEVKPHYIDVVDAAKQERVKELINKGKEDKDSIAEYSLMFYYTRDFAETTDDVELYMETIIGDMNLGYENSNIPVRVRLHCIEAADLDDEDSSSDMLHAFNSYKPSYEEIRETADAAQLLANYFHNCGSGYTYTAASGGGHTLTTVKKSCAFGYHSSIHEVGHNFGCQHDAGNGHNSHYSYGYGYLLGPDGLDNTGYRTVMAYNADGHKTRVNFMSNPNVDYKGYPTGDAAHADNARVVTENRFAMADIGDESGTCNPM